MTQETLQKLHERYSELYARAHQLDLMIPNDLTVDFETVEVGRTVCASLTELLRFHEVPEEETSDDVAGAASEEETAPKVVTRKASRKKATPKVEAQPASITEAKQEKDKTMPNTKKASVAKKASRSTARKAVGKVSKKVVTKKKTGDKIGKILALLKHGATRPQILKLTGWKAVSVQDIANRAGLNLKVDSKERPFKYKVA